MKAALLLWPLLPLLLAACASPSVLPVADIAQPPLSSQASPSFAARQQTLYAAYADQEAILQCGLSSDNGGFQAQCFTPLGLPVLNLAVDAAGTIRAEKGFGVPAFVQPERILADVQLAYWPMAALEKAYQGSDWRVEDLGHSRRLLQQGRLVAEVHYQDPQHLWLVNFSQKYSLRIETVLP